MMYPPDLLPSKPPHLSEQLERRINAIRSRIVKTNYNTQFAQTASELAEFRHATAGVLDGMEDAALSEVFQKTAQFTNYDAYAPIIVKFFEKSCKKSAIVDLFSPGVPDFLLGSSSTTGSLRKWFPRYNSLATIRSSYHAGSSVPLGRRTEAYIRPLWDYKLHIEDEDHGSMTIYLTSVSIHSWRMRSHLDPEKDEEKMATFVLNHTAPYAAASIMNWRSFLLIHALFALGTRSLETMSATYVGTIVDMIRFFDTEFDTMVDCIADGTIPDLDGISEVRHHLEMNMSPDPERASELRTLGRPSSRPGWCSLVWPNLRSVTGIGSGAFASPVPLARWFLGPNIDILSHRYASTEAVIALPYNPLELNQFKPLGENIIEFLDVSKSDSISSLAQLWEVEQGKRYEVVITTPNGLWRYRLQDVVEIAGFDPTDGVPILQFVERRQAVLRFQNCMVRETELRGAISSAFPNTLVDWTATIDDSVVPDTIGFFAELSESGDQVPDLVLATDRVLDSLSAANENIAWGFEQKSFRKPTIRVVRSGTFSDFRQLKLDEGNNNIGQIKVPVVLPKAAYVTWFSQRVVQEL